MGNVIASNKTEGSDFMVVEIPFLHDVSDSSHNVDVSKFQQVGFAIVSVNWFRL
jgi:hypothetical protein